MKCVGIAITILLMALVPWLSADAQQEEALEGYFFFSPACPPCDAVAPVIMELRTIITMRGFFYGKGDAEAMPFEVRKADKDALTRYDVHKFPTLVMIKTGAVIQVFMGEQDIKEARLILSAFRKGAWSVSEVIEKKPQNKHGVTGWVVNKGEYFHNPQFYLTDRRQSVLIKPWLPIEAARSPFRKKRPRLMSDVIDKPVYLEGMIQKVGDKLQFTVEKEQSFE